MSDADDVMYEHMLFGEQAPTEGLGGDRPYGTPTEVIELGKADALTGPLVGRDAPARHGAGPERHHIADACEGHVCQKCGTDIPWCVATDLCDHCLDEPMGEDAP